MASWVVLLVYDSIGAVYNLIHEINHKVADLATDLLEQRRGNDILLVEMQ